MRKNRARLLPHRLWLILVGCLAGCTLAAAEPAKQKTEDAPPKFPAAPSATNKNEAKSPPTPTLPDEYKVNLLIRSMVIAVNQANKTGNYTVLRDLGSPRFRKSNSPEQLATIFEAQRKSNFDFSPILFFTPKLIRPVALTDDGMLRVTGFFDTRPQRVAFDFLFEDVMGEWQPYGINIATQAAPKGGVPNEPAGQ
jgi:hypothetical protein